MLEIKEDIKEFIQKNKEDLTTAEILRLVRDYIEEGLSIGLNKKTVLKQINSKLNLDISYQAFYSFLRRNNLLNQTKTTQSYQKQITETNNKDNKPKKTSSFKDPFEMLKTIK